jgi:predicted small secreted protein
MDVFFNKQTVLSETEFKAAVKLKKDSSAFKFQKNIQGIWWDMVLNKLR